MEKTDKRLKSNFLFFKRLICSLVLLLAFLACSDAKAAINLITDEETEQYLAGVLRPIFKAAGIPFKRNNIHIVDDNSLNAFVGDGNNMFINTGTLIKAGSSNEIKGVLAHETGHIQGGHILRQKIKNQEMQQISLGSLILAGAVGAATGRADVGMAIALGSQSSAINNYLTYRIEEERSADEAAVNLLGKTKQSPQGMLTFMKRIQQQNRLSGVDETAYIRTHPVTGERVAFMEQAVSASPYPQKDKDEEQFRRVQAKLSAFLSEPSQTLQKYPLSDKSVPARYARAIAYFKQLKTAQALNEINSLIAQEPDNPHFKELKGQIYMETGKVKEAKAEFQKSLALMPNSALFQINLAQAVLESSPSQSELRKNVDILNKSLVQNPNSFAWLLLSRTYGELEDYAASNYAAAEHSLGIGAVDIAEKQAKQAENSATDSKLKLKINDLLTRIKEIKNNS